MNELMKCVYVFIGGGIGSASRFLTARFFTNFFNTTFPLGVTVVNLAGCFFIGLLLPHLSKGEGNTYFAYLLIIVGFLGGFTTFSSFGSDFMTLFQNKELMKAFAFFLINNILGIALVFLGNYFSIKI